MRTRLSVFFLILTLNISCSTDDLLIGAEEGVDDTRIKYSVSFLFNLSDFKADSFGTAAQGMDIYDNTVMFQAGLPGNVIHILNLNTRSLLGTIQFKAPTGESSHMNNINCGNKYLYSDNYPLLYISQTTNSHACFVIRLSNAASSYELIQTIKYVGNLHHVNSYYDWFIDLENRLIYTYGYYNGLLEEREIVKFPLPSLEYSEVVYTDDDVIDSMVLSNMSIYQGSRIINGLLYAPVGYGDKSYPGFLKIINLNRKMSIRDISINCGEPESLGQYKDGAILCRGGKNPAYYFVKL